MKAARALLVVLCGCSGYPEARRSAHQMADASDAYLREVGRRLTDEQGHLERARAAREGEARREREARRAWEREQPPVGTIDLVEQMVREEKALKLPGDLYDALLEANARREAEARARAAERAAVRRAYAAALARLEEKRGELARLRAVFESLARELSIDARIAYIERMATHARDANRSSAGAPEPER
jgi:hypothetical protein